MTQSVEISNQHFELHPSGAVYWAERSMLMIADVHFGKIAHFRKNGAAVPVAASARNFEQLNSVVQQYKADNICFLGDLFHSSYNNAWLPFEKWVRSCRSKIVLVAGNHDIIDPHKYESLGIEVVPSIELEGFLLTHHPVEMESRFNFSGHIHPAVRLFGRGRQRLKLACFFKTTNQLILPAFGTFTGKHTLKPNETDEIFAIVDGEVMHLN